MELGRQNYADLVSTPDVEPAMLCLLALIRFLKDKPEAFLCVCASVSNTLWSLRLPVR